MKYLIKFTFILLFVSACFNASAVPAVPFPIRVTQPDGNEITIMLKGDEHSHYHTSADGYALVKNSKGYFNYATLNNKGQLIDSEIQASDIEKRNVQEKNFLKSVPKNIPFTKNLQYAQNRIKSIQSRVIQQPMKFPKAGSPKSLVILVNFSDLSFVIPTPQTAFTNLLNQSGYSANGGTGSARDYFRDNSMGAFNPQFDVVGPFTLPQPYSFYGANDANKSDQNPTQMVVDACKAAYNNGINFANYDTDNDGVVDNIFVYYAGYNEAEGAPANTVWPHRWGVYPNDLFGTNGNYSGNTASVTFNGKRIEDYACTSELRGNSGANMCGIGTFCHEFGHVLGLADFYNTENQDSYTLMSWDIMDAGAYLNQGRTPPAYSSYERFYLGFLTPEELKTPKTVILDNLTKSNKAYLISSSGNHNLDGQNPVPVEFFMLENRQKTGWDTYLPGHGMLITHVYFNKNDWDNNTVNNNQEKLGVDLVEADGLATKNSYSGDPFPGSANVQSYIPALRSKATLQKPLTNIEETNGLIMFDFMGGVSTIPAPVAYDAKDVSFDRFTATWSPVSEANGYYITAYSISDGTSSITQSFKNGTDTVYNGWEISAGQTNNINESGSSPKALVLRTNQDSITTETYPAPVTHLSFYLRALSSNKGELSLKAWNGSSWTEVEKFDFSSYTNGVKKEYDFEASRNYTRFKWSYLSTSGAKISVDDITVNLSKRIDFVAYEKYLTTTSDTLKNLLSDTEYYYKVRASKKTKYYETVSGFSNTMTAKTPTDTSVKLLRIAADAKNGIIQVVLPPNELNNLYIYDTTGRLHKIITPTFSRIYITDLMKNTVYIFKSGKRVAKVVF